MSGIFWEASYQPDLWESLAAFGTSSMSLALALPMCGVDLVCCLLLSLGTMVFVVVTPCIHIMEEAAKYILSTTGLEDTWSHNHTIILCLFLYSMVAHLLSRTCNSTYQQFFSKLTGMTTAILWITNFLLFPSFQTAEFTRMGLLSLSLQIGIVCVRGLFLEQAGYRHNPPTTSLKPILGGYLGMLKMEVMAAMIICAFGYPGSQAGKIPSYYCMVPFIATQVIYFTTVHQTENVIEGKVNGHVTVIKEVLNAKIEEIKEICGDKVTEVKEKIEDVVEKAIDENPEILEAAAKVESAGQIIENEIEEVKEFVKEGVEIIGEIVEEIKDTVDEKIEKIVDKVDGKIEDVKADPVFQKVVKMLQSLYTSVVALLSSILSLLSNMATTITSKLSQIPWVSLLLLVTTMSSHVLYSAAWHHLTGSSLALVLPLLTLALPLILKTVTPRLPSYLPAYIEETQTLCLAGITYLLVTATGGTDTEA